MSALKNLKQFLCSGWAQHQAQDEGLLSLENVPSCFFTLNLIAGLHDLAR